MRSEFTVRQAKSAEKPCALADGDGLFLRVIGASPKAAGVMPDDLGHVGMLTSMSIGVLCALGLALHPGRWLRMAG